MNLIKTHSNWSILNTTLFIAGFLLNQSSVVMGVNFSLADFAMLACLFLMIYNRTKLEIPRNEIVFFSLLILHLISTPFTLVPLLHGFFPDLGSVIREAIKLSVLLFYFIMGYNFKKHKLSTNILVGFAYGTLLLSILSIISTFTNISFFKNIFYYGGYRFKGLMNDPNYFSVLQLCGLAYFYRASKLSKTYKTSIIILLIFSILASGSKTGFVSLLLYISIIASIKLIQEKVSLNTIVFAIVFVLTFFLGLFIIQLESLSNTISEYLPVYKRIVVLINNFEEGVSDGGSSRNKAWGIAFNLIKSSPILGVGVGTYSSLGRIYYGSGVIAHNTYLQLAVEWGLLFTFIFLLYIFNLIYKVYATPTKKVEILAYNDTLIVLLLGSLAISLNNARLFWLSLGIIKYYCIKNNKKKVNNEGIIRT